ncbi:DUF1801 domain-containing protein [Spongiimicrobium sp. 2-473A-2-J]|uniref:DUF1801 domain-containing protein n=1 Tax=Eudoraea algarum TaxID=3417568 RepID=UPI003D368606
MNLTKTFKIEEKLDAYPKHVRQKLMRLRQLILETAAETEGVNTLEETLKWGEPSYLTKNGSTIRIDWKEKKPDQYAMYFKCTSKLVPSFRTIYKEVFTFEGDRALVFKMDDTLPETELKKCIAAGLTYHKVKHLPLLGL